MILSTTPSLEGHTITDYLGLVTGEAILGANIFRDMLSNITDIIGGRAGAYEHALTEAKEIAEREMKQKAQELGATAVVGIDIDYETVKDGMLMVSITGTAVKLKK